MLTVVAAYAAWLATGALGLGVAYVWRAALLDVYVRLGLNKWAFAAFSNAVVLALLLTWLVLIIIGETWFRQQAGRGRLRDRVVRVVLAELAVIALGYALYHGG